MNGHLVAPLKADKADRAAALLALGMGDNPLHRQVFGEDARRRKRALYRMFLPFLRQQASKEELLGVRQNGELLGLCGLAPPGECQPTLGDKLKMAPAVLRGAGLEGAWRILRWTSAWASRDPRQPHWHLGPLAVHPRHQGQGIGSALIEASCQRVDADGGEAYLETDKPANVRLYRRFGFAVVGKQRVLGARNWFMWRAASATEA